MNINRIVELLVSTYSQIVFFFRCCLLSDSLSGQVKGFLYFSVLYIICRKLSLCGCHSHRTVTPQPFIKVRVSDNYVLINQANCSRIIFVGRLWWISSFFQKNSLLTTCRYNSVVLITYHYYESLLSSRLHQTLKQYNKYLTLQPLIFGMFIMIIVFKKKNMIFESCFFNVEKSISQYLRVITHQSSTRPKANYSDTLKSGRLTVPPLLLREITPNLTKINV